MEAGAASAARQLRFLSVVTGFSYITQEIDFGSGVARYIAAGAPAGELAAQGTPGVLRIELRVPARPKAAKG